MNVTAAFSLARQVLHERAEEPGEWMDWCPKNMDTKCDLPLKKYLF